MQEDAFDVRGKNPRVLWLAVVEAALRDSMEPKPTVRRSAREWIMRDDLDFPLICEMAGLDSDYLRNMMAAKFRRASSSPIAPEQPSEPIPFVLPQSSSEAEPFRLSSPA